MTWCLCERFSIWCHTKNVMFFSVCIYIFFYNLETSSNTDLIYCHQAKLSWVTEHLIYVHQVIYHSDNMETRWDVYVFIYISLTEHILTDTMDQTDLASSLRYKDSVFPDESPSQTLYNTLLKLCISLVAVWCKVVCMGLCDS